MLDLLTLLPVILAIVNATVPVGNGEVQIPFQVQPLGSPQTGVPQQQSGTAGPIDYGGLTALVGSIGTVLGVIGFKVVKDKKTEDTRSNIIADTNMQQQRSLQATDKGIMEITQFMVKLARKTDTPELIDEAERIEKAHCKDYRLYYENIQPDPNLDYSKDPVIRKSSAVQKRSNPTPED